MFDEDYYRIIAKEDPHVLSGFEGFTHFSNSVGKFSTTNYAIPYLLTQRPIIPQQSYNDYLHQAYGETQFFRDLKEAGYQIDLYTSEAYVPETMLGTVHNLTQDRLVPTSNWIMFKKLYRFTASKYLPHTLKKYVWFQEDEFQDVYKRQPQNAYGAAKVAARYLCGELASSLGLPMVYMVFTGIYGVGREDKNVLFYTIDSLLRGQRPSVTRLEQRWDFVQIDDAVSALIAGGEKGKAGAFYAVGNGDNRPLAEFLYIVRDLIDPALPLGVGDVPYKDSRLPNSAIDTTALQADKMCIRDRPRIVSLQPSIGCGSTWMPIIMASCIIAVISRFQRNT